MVKQTLSACKYRTHTINSRSRSEAALEQKPQKLVVKGIYCIEADLEQKLHKHDSRLAYLILLTFWGIFIEIGEIKSVKITYIF